MQSAKGVSAYLIYSWWLLFNYQKVPLENYNHNNDNFFQTIIIRLQHL